jgi:nicotinamidase-related amidase
MDTAGYETKTFRLDPAETVLIGMHCWNIGCDDGPPIDNNFYVGMGFPEATIEAGRIMKEAIRPAMDAARKAGIMVCHVETELIARNHSEALIDQDENTTPFDPSLFESPGWRKEMADYFHGRDYLTKSPLAKMDRAAIVSPMPGEPYVHQTGQLDRVLKRHGIKNLIYAGFCTDMCVLRAPGGIEQMAPKGYKILLMRDATLGAESPDTFEERMATRWGIRYFETHYGHTLLLHDFCAALQK